MSNTNIPVEDLHSSYIAQGRKWKITRDSWDYFYASESNFVLNGTESP